MTKKHLQGSPDMEFTNQRKKKFSLNVTYINLKDKKIKLLTMHK